MVEKLGSLKLVGELENVRQACDFVVAIGEQVGLDERGVFQCQLSVEEVFTNIVEHGYQYAGDDKHIEILIERGDGALLISIIDEAPPFNPLALEDPNPDTPLWERDNGGWGVYFVRQYMDDVRYRLENERNRLILEKKFPQAPGDG